MNGPPLCRLSTRLLSTRLLSILAVVLLVGCPREPEEPPAAHPIHPSVFVISIDTLRADHLPAYGYGAVETPAIDALRRDGVLFEDAYTSCPLTLPAHTSLMTGLSPPEHGVRDNVGYRLDAAHTPTLAQRLSTAGYTTGAAVSAYVLRADTGMDAGFESYDDRIEVQRRGLGEQQRSGARTVDAALAWLEGQSGPVLFFLHLFEPHSPYSPPAPFDRLYDSPYDGEIAAADHEVGRFLEWLREHGLYDDALIVLLSDHGEGLGDHGEEEHGLLLHRETIRVPLLIKLPAGAQAGSTVRESVQLLDVLPTVLEVAGLAGASELPGTSLTGTDQLDGRPLYSESYYARLHFGWSELRSLVEGGYHYIGGPSPELYDIRADPGETDDLLAEKPVVARKFGDALAALDPRFAPPGELSPDEMASLRALGYATAPAAASTGLDPKDGLPILRRVEEAERAIEDGRRAEAASILAGVLETQPGMLDVRFLLGPLLVELGRPQDALGIYQQGLETSALARNALLVEIGRLHLELGQPELAADHARSVLAELPVEAHQLLAQVAAQQGDLETAAAEAAAAISAEQMPRAESLLLLASIEIAGGRFAASLENLDTLQARVDAGDLAPVRGLQSARGDALGRLGRLEEAESALLAEIGDFPGNTLAYSRLAFVYGSLRRFDRIEPLLEQMVRASPLPETMMLAAETAQRLGDEQGAREWRRRARSAAGD